MRILALDLGPEWRGGQVQTLLVSSRLAARGHEVTVGAREGSPLLSRARSAGLPVAALPSGGEAAPRLLVRLSRVTRDLAPDVVWTGDSHGHGAALWSGASRRVPLVVHRRVVFAPGGNPFSRLKYSRADRFIAVSAAVRDSLVSAGVAPDRIAVVPDGLPAAAFLEAPVPGAPPWRLVHVGAFDGRKGQGLVVDVLARLVADGLDVTCTFLGDGPERPAVEERARGLGLLERCGFAGRVDDVAPRLAASHLLLLPTDSDAAPLVLLEAMAAGCPFLAHDVGGVAEVACGGDCGRLVASLDLGPWTEAARELLLDPAARAAFVAAGRAAVAERTIDRTAALVEGELLAAGRRG